MDWNQFNTAHASDFYAQDPLVVAPALLGDLLVHNHPERGWIVGRIVETEAYRGTEDLACHASKGETSRTAPMFGDPGYAYVYLIYGMYDMFNAVTWPKDQPSAVLVRAVEPVHNIDRTTDGPGKLTRALGINRAHNTLNLSTGCIRIVPDQTIPPEAIEQDRRIGVDYAGVWAQKPWRFYVRSNVHVSKRRG